MSYAWIIEERLAQAPLPSLGDIPRLARGFTGIIVLTTDGEHSPIYIDRLKEHGLDVLHIPTRDHHPVELLDLLRAIQFIRKHIESHGAVLVHCYGGIGRSGLTTSAYLVYSGKTVYDAVRYVRSRVNGAVENRWQMQMLENLEALVNNVERGLLERYIEAVIEIYKSSRVEYYHMSKVLQLTLEIVNNTHWHLRNLDLKKTMHTALFHIHSSNLSDIGRQFLGSIRPSEQDPIVDLAHLMDYKMDSRVVTLDIDADEKNTNIRLLCREDCSEIVGILNDTYGKRGRILGYEVEFDWDYYLNYI